MPRDLPAEIMKTRESIAGLSRFVDEWCAANPVALARLAEDRRLQADEPVSVRRPRRLILRTISRARCGVIATSIWR